MSTTTTQGGFSGFVNSRGMSVFLLLLAIVILGFLIANAVYFNKIKNDQNQTSTKKSEANTMMWINIVLAILMGIFVFYCAWRSLQSPEYVKVVQAQALATADIYYNKAAQNVSAVTTTVNDLAMPLNQVYYPGANKDPIFVKYEGNGIYLDPTGKAYTCPDYNCVPIPNTVTLKK